MAKGDLAALAAGRRARRERKRRERADWQAKRCQRACGDLRSAIGNVQEAGVVLADSIVEALEQQLARLKDQGIAHARAGGWPEEDVVRVFVQGEF